MLESRILKVQGQEVYIEGYFLTIKELEKLVRDFQVDCYDGFVSNDRAYIENWIKNNKI